MKEVGTIIHGLIKCESNVKLLLLLFVNVVDFCRFFAFGPYKIYRQTRKQGEATNGRHSVVIYVPITSMLRISRVGWTNTHRQSRQYPLNQLAKPSSCSAQLWSSQSDSIQVTITLTLAASSRKVIRCLNLDFFLLRASQKSKLLGARWIPAAPDIRRVQLERSCNARGAWKSLAHKSRWLKHLESYNNNNTLLLF